MWDENFKKFLYEGINAKDGYSLSEAEVALQKYFGEIISGMKPSKDNAKVFYGVRDGALTLLTTLFDRNIDEVLDTSYQIGVAKNQDYGSVNILQYGVVGLIVRLGDKIARAINLLKEGSTQFVANEKVEDTIMDMVNYATYGIMLCNGVWL